MEMLTRLQVKGFKSLWDVDVRFGPFTCIAGPNAVGKSNLFDVIQFLSRLASDPLLEAALSVRAREGANGRIRDLFHRWKDASAKNISIAAEMIIPQEGIDDLGQKARATITTVKYSLEIEFSGSEGFTEAGMMRLISEELVPLPKGDATSTIQFPNNLDWRNSVVTGRRNQGAPFISTNPQKEIELHQDGKSGRSRRHLIASLPRTVLSKVNALESPTALLVKKEMESWKLLQLEPSALRLPDSFLTSPGLLANGAHMPRTLFELARNNGMNKAVYERVAGRLTNLLDDIKALAIDKDDKRELFTLQIMNKDGTLFDARSLSDGTLRFLALATVAEDPTSLGVICLEEPENGIQPGRITAILKLLKAIACDPFLPSGEDNPLRQVIINTHSPLVVKLLNDNDLLLATSEQRLVEKRRIQTTSFTFLSNTWRDKKKTDADFPTVVKGKLLDYLNPIPSGEPGPQKNAGIRERRVIDRPEFGSQLELRYYE
jgi:predicted ATPase